MGRRGGTAPPSSRRKQPLSSDIIHRRINSQNINHYPPEDIARILHDSYPDYRLHFKLQPFTAKIKQLLSSHRPRPIDDCHVSPDEEQPVRKKHRRIDDSEERLLRRETEHLLRRRNGNVSFAVSSSEESVSTSEDAVYGEEVQPEFDLMKDMLRVGYQGSTSKSNAKIEQNVEVDDVRKDKRVVETVKTTSEVVEEGVGGGGGGGGREAKGREEGVVRFSDIGGIKGVIDELKMEVIVPLYHPQLPQWLGVKPMAGILLHGPPGCGKTKLAHAIANETGVPFYQISATEVVSGVSGASEENIRELFSKAYRTAPSIVFIDEIDAIASKRENLQREMERRIVTQLLTCMDESHRLVQSNDKNSDTESSLKRSGYVLVIGATNRPDAVDPALRRPGRFDREIALGVPDENGRVEILSVLTQKLRLSGDFDLVKLARATPGFVGADLAALANKAGNLAMKRIIDQRRVELAGDDGERDEEWWREPWSSEEMEKLNITMADFEEAAKMVQPSSRREGFSAIPNVKWEDVGGLDTLREEFERFIVRRIKHPEYYEKFGVDMQTGFLLYGPPGCGKTLIAKAVANEAGANFIHIKGPELLNKYVGESELHVRTIFSRARTCAPCILFFDEVDALTTKRGKEGGWVVERLVNQLLIELDGAEQRQGVYVIGATNRPDVIDRALLRPGRLGKKLYVPLPSPDECGLILKTLGRKKPIDQSVDLFSLGRSSICENLSGADLVALMNEAAMAAMDENMAANKENLTSIQSSVEAGSFTITATHFEQARRKVIPSVSEKEKQYYEHLSSHFQAT